MILKSLAFIVLSLSLNQAQAAASKGLVKIRQGHEVYTEYYAPKSGRPTVVLVNGLVYDLKNWDEYTEALVEKGVGVLRYNFRGQSKTLLAEIEDKKTPRFFEDGLTPEIYAQELAQVLNEVGLKEEKVTVVGLSYGASIAAEFTQKYPKRVESLILLAPLVVSLDRYNPAGAWIRWNLDAIRFWWGPIWGPAAYDYYYDMIFRSYLVDQRLSSDRVPAEMKDVAGAYKESVFHQVRAVRDFDLRGYDFKKSKVHLVLASEEQPLAYADQIRAWNAWDKDARASIVYLDKASHAIPSDSTPAAVRLTLQVLEGEKSLSGGRIYRVEGSKTSECKDIKAMKDGACE